jgi:hypothetical protein
MQIWVYPIVTPDYDSAYPRPVYATVASPCIICLAEFAVNVSCAYRNFSSVKALRQRILHAVYFIFKVLRAVSNAGMRQWVGGNSRCRKCGE